MHKIFALKFVSYEKSQEICENELVASLKVDHDFIIHVVLNDVVLESKIRCSFLHWLSPIFVGANTGIFYFGYNLIK